MNGTIESLQCDQQLFCNSSTCNGCCAGGECLPGTDNTACGSNGAACQFCVAGSQRCKIVDDSYQCMCDEVSCPSGCCDQNNCRAGTSDSACGNAQYPHDGQVSCLSCGTGYHCGGWDLTNGLLNQNPPADHYDGITAGGVWGGADEDSVVTYAVGSGGKILQWNEDAYGWDLVYTLPVSDDDDETPHYGNLGGIWGASKTDVYAVGFDSSGMGYPVIVKYDGSWHIEETFGGATGMLTSVWGTSSTDIWAVGWWRTDSGGDGTRWCSLIVHRDETSWTIDNFSYGQCDALGSYSEEGLLGVWGSSSTNVFAVGGGILQSTTGWTWNDSQDHTKGGGGGWGFTYPSYSGDSNLQFAGVWGSSPYDVWVSTWNNYGTSRGGDMINLEIWSGNGGYIGHYGNSANPWPVDSSVQMPNFKLGGFWGTSSNDVFVTGSYHGPDTPMFEDPVDDDSANRGVIYHCTKDCASSGGNWRGEGYYGYVIGLSAIGGADVNHLFAIGVSGTNLKYKHDSCVSDN